MRANPVAYAVSAVRRALAGAEAPGALAGSAARDLAVCAAFAAAALALAMLATRRAASLVSLADVLPTVNAALNALAFVLLALGFARSAAATGGATAP